jgi:hypothetical protein
VLGYTMEVRQEMGYSVSTMGMMSQTMGLLVAGIDTSGTGLTNLLFFLTQVRWPWAGLSYWVVWACKGFWAGGGGGER